MKERKRPHIIIIDDESLNNLVSEMFIKLHFPYAEIQSFTSIVAGLDYLSQEYPVPSDQRSVILLDINMPLLSGWDALRAFENFSDTIKNKFSIYLSTSSIAFEDKQKAKENPSV